MYQTLQQLQTSDGGIAISFPTTIIKEEIELVHCPVDAFMAVLLYYSTLQVARDHRSNL